ncbi:4-hydroxythreonine-4-phosphate dehydrogenase PdxA [soil metagenome]
MNEKNKPVIGFSCGDLNGIGIELIIKSLADSRILELCTPVVFASNKSINFYRKSLPDINFQYQSLKDVTKLNTKMINVVNCWEEEVQMSAGQLTDTGGHYARISLLDASTALKNGHIDALVTAPLHKSNVQGENFNYTGHTPFLRDFFGAEEVVMLMVAENMRVALLTEHVPVKDVAGYVTQDNILKKLKTLIPSLKKDFGVDKPIVAVLALNPHSGDEGLIGMEEIDIIKPAIAEAQQQGMLVYGPFSADAFFARGQHEKFDAVLAMYHDQGLIPFKSLAVGEGINYTAGLNVVRTSPDHGTALDIARKGKADHASFLEALYQAIDIINRRKCYDENRANPLRRMNQRIINPVHEAEIHLPE